MRIIITLSTLFFSVIAAYSQPYVVKGTLIDNIDEKPLNGARITIMLISDSEKNSTTSGLDGQFQLSISSMGEYIMTATLWGFRTYSNTFYVKKNLTDLGKIKIKYPENSLKEVKIVEKKVSVSQKEDTIEYNARAFKTNPDADGVDLVKKMPTIEINGAEVKAQGEIVGKVFVDGKPYFGSDAYASLSNLPAAMIKKIQIYNEKSEQEQFTGFTEGNTTKTINIITNENFRPKQFGKATVGKDIHDRYAANGNINQYNEDHRLTITAQSNNVNQQNFTEQNQVGANISGGNTVTNAVGINFINTTNKKLDISMSYFYNDVSRSRNLQQQKTFIIPVASGQIYKEQSINSSKNYNHSLNTRINIQVDSSNSLLVQLQMTLQSMYSNIDDNGVTTQADSTLNKTYGNVKLPATSKNLSASVLYRHKFPKKGQTFSINLSVDNSNNNGNKYLYSENSYFQNILINNTINQRTLQQQSNWNINSNFNYTQSISKYLTTKIQFANIYSPSYSVKTTDDYSYQLAGYAIPDTPLSNIIYKNDLKNKIGGSLQLSGKHGSLSVGIFYQSSMLKSEQTMPEFTKIRRKYDMILPVIHFQYRFSKASNFEVQYNANTNTPSINQLQNVINNNNSLQLQTGNPSIKESYQHNIIVRYNASNYNNSSVFSIRINGSITQQSIANNVIVAQKDTFVAQNILLTKGGQISYPTNINGAWNLKGYGSYGMPIHIIKCNLNMSLSATVNQMPSIINNTVNYQIKKTGVGMLSISSNIDKYIDFTIAYTTAFNFVRNSDNSNLNTLFITQTYKSDINIIFWKRFVITSNLFFQRNTNSLLGYDNNSLLWNIALGKKLFRKNQGEIKLFAYDVLKQNSNINYSINDAYVQVTKTNNLGQYFMLILSYRLNE